MKQDSILCKPTEEMWDIFMLVCVYQFLQRCHFEMDIFLLVSCIQDRNMLKYSLKIIGYNIALKLTAQNMNKPLPKTI